MANNHIGGSTAAQRNVVLSSHQLDLVEDMCGSITLLHQGRVVLRGRARPVDLLEPAPDFSHSDRVKLEKAIELVDSNRSAAIPAIEGILASNPADKALQNLLMRCRELNEEGSYVLG